MFFPFRIGRIENRMRPILQIIAVESNDLFPILDSLEEPSLKFAESVVRFFYEIPLGIPHLLQSIHQAVLISELRLEFAAFIESFLDAVQLPFVIVLEVVGEAVRVFLSGRCFRIVGEMLSYRLSFFEPLDRLNRTVGVPGKGFPVHSVIFKRSEPLGVPILVIPFVLAGFLSLVEREFRFDLILAPPGQNGSLQLVFVEIGFKERSPFFAPLAVPALLEAESEFGSAFQLAVFKPFALDAIGMVGLEVGVEARGAVGLPFAHLPVFKPFGEMDSAR